MSGLWARFVSAMAHREPATPLALFRVAVATVVLTSTLHLVGSGVVPLVLFDDAHGGMTSLKPSNLQWNTLGLAHTPDVVWGIVWAVVALSALLAVGLGGRVTAFALLQACLLLFAINPMSGGGHDKLLTNALWLLVLSPATATLSVDCRLRTGAWWSTRPVVAWPRYLAVLQICLVYTLTGVQKLGSEWLPWGGWSALYYSLLLPSWSRWPIAGWLGWAYPLTQLGTAVTWLWESSFLVVLLAFWFRATRERPGRLRALSNRVDLRAVYLVVGVVMHLGIFAFMNVGPFSWAAMSFYVAAFHHDEWSALWRRLRGRQSTAQALDPPASAPPPAPA